MLSQSSASFPSIPFFVCLLYLGTHSRDQLSKPKSRLVGQEQESKKAHQERSAHVQCVLERDEAEEGFQDVTLVVGWLKKNTQKKKQRDPWVRECVCACACVCV